MTILTRGYGQTDRQTNRPTLLPIELLDFEFNLTDDFKFLNSN